MKAKLIQQQAEKPYAVIVDKGDEVMAGLLDMAKRHNLAGSHVTAIGAFSDAILGYFDRDRKDYQRIPVHEQVEVLSLVGDIALSGDQPKIHAHVVVGRSDGTTRGGHLMEAHVWPTLEVIIVEEPGHLHRKTDQESGLALIDIAR